MHHQPFLSRVQAELLAATEATAAPAERAGCPRTTPASRAGGSRTSPPPLSARPAKDNSINAEPCQAQANESRARRLQAGAPHMSDHH